MKFKLKDIVDWKHAHEDVDPIERKNCIVVEVYEKGSDRLDRGAYYIKPKRGDAFMAFEDEMTLAKKSKSSIRWFKYKRNCSSGMAKWTYVCFPFDIVLKNHFVDEENVSDRKIKDVIAEYIDNCYSWSEHHYGTMVMRIKNINKDKELLKFIKRLKEDNKKSIKSMKKHYTDYNKALNQ